ncbi:MAG: hypothetical protein IPF54_24330 [Draconibacterium sp.]|nr:hypothetical protein [Draconibacterium sp.]
MNCKNIFFLLLTVSIVLLVPGCNGQNNPNASNKISNNSDKMNTESTKYTAGKEYTQFVRARIMDKVGFEQPVEAFSILILITGNLTEE